MQGLVIRKHADKSGPQPDDGPWPLAGVSLVSAPKVTTISTSLLQQAVGEGWASVEGANAVVRPAGPTQDVWNSTHTGQPHVFIHHDRIVFHTLDGDVVYRVTRQPDKYADHGAATYPDQVKAFKATDDTQVTPDIYAAGATRVDHFYVIEMEG